jgi:hypothetical protein
MTLHQLGNVFEAIMEKGQDQIPDDGFLMTNMLMYFIVTVDKILLCLGVSSTLADPNLHPNPNANLNLNPNLNPYPNLNHNPKPNSFVGNKMKGYGSCALFITISDFRGLPK